jgi:hypothetical protein
VLQKKEKRKNMVVFNIGCHLEQSLYAQYELWLREYFLPDVQAIALVQEVQPYKLATVVDEGVASVIVQLNFANELLYGQFEQQHQPRLLGAIAERFGSAVYCFSTVMVRI